MANADTPKGFQPTGIMYGLGRYEIDAGTSTAVFRNDLIEADDDDSSGDDGYAVLAAAGGTMILGSVQGTTSATTAQKALVAASTAATLLVTDHPDQKYIAQDDGDSTTSAQTNVFNNADVVVGAGSTTTGLSGHEIDISDVKTATAQIRLIDIQRRPDNAFGANADWLCRINEHFYGSTTGT